MKKKNFKKMGSELILTPFLLTMIIVISLSPLILRAEDPVPAVEDKISFDLKDVDIIELLRILSLKTGKTIVPSRNVSGRITIFLNKVTFQDVLDIILVSQGLACDQKGEIVYIMANAEYKSIYGKDYKEPRKMEMVRLTYAKPANVFNAVSQLKSEIGKIVADEASGTIILIDIPEKIELLQKTIKELDRPLETVVYDLNYAKASDAKAQLSSAITPGTGEVIVDERSGKAIVSDLPKKMEKLKNIVKALDEETRQVFIEGEIVQVTLSENFKRGIDWEKVLSAKYDGLDFIGKFPISPVLSAYQNISVGTVARDKYTSVINLLKVYGDTETLSRPKIAIVNNEEGHIMVGVRDAYVTQTLSQAQSTTVTSEQIEFIDVGVKLKIVPKISSDGFITMKIKPEVSSVRETITTSLGSRIPIVQTSEVETVIKIKDGTTILLGGLLERTDTDSIQGLPGLSRMPVLGALFGTRTREKKKTEIVVFITPHLIRGDIAKAGTEPEKFIPPKIMPEDLRQKVIAKELNKVEDRFVLSSSRSSTSLDARDYYNKGFSSQESEELDEALNYYKKAVSLDSGFAAAYNQMGIIFEAQSNLKEAEKMYFKAVNADPNYAPVYSNLALLNESRNDIKKALEYWLKRSRLGGASDPWASVALKRVEQINALEDK